MEDQLVSAGLNNIQALVYLHLLEKGQASPPQAAKALGLSRTNVYKVLDRLVELRLAKRQTRDGKAVYQPDNPLALSLLAAEQRNLATAQEEAVKNIIGNLLESYYSHSEQPSVQVVTGKTTVVEAYRQQIDLQKPIYFIRSRSDIASLGFETMHEIRVAPARHDVKRYGITPAPAGGPTNPQNDQRSNLKRTWTRTEDYLAPVEWSISGPTLLIVLFGSEPHAVTITSPIIAAAFKQLWQLLDNCLRAMPYYSDLPTSQSTT